MLKVIKLAFVAALLAALGSVSWAQDSLRGPILLTVSGNVANPSRGPVDPAHDKFLTAQDVTFDMAAEFDFAALSTVLMVEITTDFPQGGAQHVFEGPPLAEVLRLAGATGTMITLRALDGYLLELPLADLLAQEPILALRRDGSFLGLGDYGPMHLVFPRGTKPELAQMDDSSWIWSVYHIHVE